MNSLPLQIGITGGIGAGKSIVCKIFATLGVPTYNADDRAKWLMNHDEALKAAIISKFSDRAYNDEGLDRQYLAEHVFHSESKLKLLNSLVHPTVAKDYQEWVSSHKNIAYVIKEAALLFETGSHQEMDKNIVVSAPETIRIARIKKRDPQRDEAQIKAIMGKQIAVSEAIGKADFVINNDGLSLLLPKVLELHQLFSIARD